MGGAGHSGRHHDLAGRVADQVAAALGAGPFDAAVGSLAQVGEAMDWLHGHGNVLSFWLWAWRTRVKGVAGAAGGR